MELSLNITGSVLLGLARVYIRKLDSFESRIQAVMIHIDKVLGLTVNVPSTKKSTPHRRTAAPAVTQLLPAVPENDSILFMNLGDVLFDSIPPALPSLAAPSTISATPAGSGRKRLLGTSTPRRQREVDDHYEDLLITPSEGFNDDMMGTKRRRMSSISEVMDSLRADDGTRRFSGMFTGTAAPSPLYAPNSPEVAETPWTTNPFTIEDDYEESVAQHLALPATGVPQTRRRSLIGVRRREQTVKSMMDKKGKRGIEIDINVIEKRKKQLMSSSQGLKPKTSILFKISSFYNDQSSFVRWYIPPVIVRPLRPAQPVSVISTPAVVYENGGTPIDDVENDLPDMVIHESSARRVSSMIRPGTETILDKVARASGPLSMKSFLTGVTKKSCVDDFIKSLHYLSEGVFSTTRRRAASSCMIGLDSVSEFSLSRGPRWESAILIS